MRCATLLVAFVVGCGHPTPPPAAAVANTAEPTEPADPAPTQPPPDARPTCRTIDGRTGSQYADQIYCQQVGDACCGSMGQVWVCNNARYVDWYFANCEPHH